MLRCQYCNAPGQGYRSVCTHCRLPIPGGQRWSVRGVFLAGAAAVAGFIWFVLQSNRLP